MEANHINIGQLDTKITVVQITLRRGSQGQKQRTQSVYGDVMAFLEPLTDEMVSDDNLEARTGMSVTIYKIPALTVRWQLVIGGVPYEIRSIDPISRWSPLCTLTAYTIEKE